MSRFIRKTQNDLERLDDEELLEYVASARDAGDFEAAQDSCGMLAFRYEKLVRSKMSLRMGKADRDEIFMEVMVSATRSAFDGKFVGQFRSWITTITVRRISDHIRKNDRSPETQLFPEEHDGEEGIVVKLGLEDANLKLLPYIELAREILSGRNEVHRRVIEAYGPVELGFQELDAASVVRQVADATGEAVSEANVHQIWKRFRVEFAAALDDADEVGSMGST